MAFDVLILDARQRSALAATRSIGRLSNVRVTTADSVPEALAGCSRFSDQYICSPCSERDSIAYINWLVELTSARKFDLVLPVTEITSQLLLMNIERFEHLRLPFADYQTVISLADKGALVEMAQKFGVPCPASRWFSSAKNLDAGSESFPVVIKPCLSKIYTGSAWVATRVRVLYSKEDLDDELQRSPYLHKHPFMLQEFIPGRGAGVFCLYDQGQPLVFFAHQRLREKPPQGGVSVLSESVAVDPKLQEYANKLLGSVKWHGVAMIEFRVSPEGEVYLMEVNTRFWGSLQLAVDAGVDFPRILWEAELARREQKPFTCVSNYRVGQRLRWLLGDVDSLYLYCRSDYSLGQKLQRLLQFFTPRFRHSRHEVNRWEDLGPARHELSSYIKQLLGR